MFVIDNKLTILFGEDRTSILFSTKKKLNKKGSIDIRYGAIHIKQYRTVSYHGCALDEEIIKTRLRCLYRKNRFLSQPLRRLLCNAIVQPQVEHACSVGILTK